VLKSLRELLKRQAFTRR